jgi:protein kinase-like protein
VVPRPDDLPTHPGLPPPGAAPEPIQRVLGATIEIRDLIGVGGFAMVYAGFDPQLKRDVAVKVLRPELAAVPAMRERFRREAEAVARLRHPHVIPIYAVGEADGIAWYVMPLVSGESLRARLDREGRLPATEARRILREAADALATAHRAGIIHRDIKPDNILLDGADRRVLLTDFGIAKALGPAPEPPEGLTATGVVIGTPQYMSPEQASGEPVDARSDIYSLGVVAYQMLTGQLPFAAATVAALLVKQMVEEAPSIMRQRPDCPGDLAAAVSRCLAKAPEQRWASADGLAQALAAPTTPTKEERRSGARAAAGLPDVVFRFRVVGVGSAGLVVAGVAADFFTQQVLFAPLGFLVGAFVVAAHYGTLWTAGYSWRDALTWQRGGTADRTPIPLDSAEFGPHAALVQQGRADRAALLALVERAPKAERRAVADVIPTVDLALAHAAELARQLHMVERQIEPGPEEIDRRLAATRAEPPSPGRDQRLLVLERRRQTVHGLGGRRDRLAKQLEECLAAVAAVRLLVDQIGFSDSEAVARIQTTVETLRARAMDTLG